MTATRLLQYVVIGNAALLIFQCVRVISVYSAVYSLTSGPRRQLPLHVWLIATSYLVYVCSTTYFLYATSLPDGLARAIIYGAAGLIGQYALYNVLGHERRKYSEATNFMDDEET